MSDQKAIDKKRREWISAVNAGRVEDYLLILAEDIIWFPPGHQVIEGKDEFREWIGPFFEKFAYEFSVSEIKVKILGDRAIERGVFTSKLTAKRGGETFEHIGRYIVFWHRRTDGRWEIERYVDEPER